jgi:hypothetical protein
LKNSCWTIAIFEQFLMDNNLDDIAREILSLKESNEKLMESIFAWDRLHQFGGVGWLVEHGDLFGD